MVVDFSNVSLKEKPVLILRNADGTAVQALGYAFNLKLNLLYNETSSISFDLPAFVDGVATPGYDKVTGLRIVDVNGWGQFILVNPSVEKTGVKEIKHCKAYSLEYELTYKKMSLPDGTYNFWNPPAPNETVLGIILSYLPSWSVGTVDSSLVGKYRTFSKDSVNVYNFIKSTVQKSFGCVFSFDTYERKIHVISTVSAVNTAPVYMSLGNLAKDIRLEEDTEKIYTRLDATAQFLSAQPGRRPAGHCPRSTNAQPCHRLARNPRLDLFFAVNDRWAPTHRCLSFLPAPAYPALVPASCITHVYYTKKAALCDLF